MADIPEDEGHSIPVVVADLEKNIRHMLERAVGVENRREAEVN